MNFMSFYAQFLNKNWNQIEPITRQQQPSSREQEKDLVQEAPNHSHQPDVTESIHRTYQRYYLERRTFL